MNKVLFYISIHAPAWGATFQVLVCLCKEAYFNPRSRVGSDSPSQTVSTVRTGFQSTLPRGERRVRLLLGAPFIGFQSTLPRGERPFSAIKFLSFCDFNPRSRVGSDLDCRLIYHFFVKFQSTLPRGERHTLTEPPVYAAYFNPRSRVGSDFNHFTDRLKVAIFQSTLPRGERPFSIMAVPSSARHFNPRSRVGSDCTHHYHSL